MPEPGSSSGQGAARRYWVENLRIVGVLLSIWAVVSLGCGVLLVDWLNGFRIGEAKLGFWISQQGSIYVFVALIAVYVVLLGRLERRLGLREE